MEQKEYEITEAVSSYVSLTVSSDSKPIRAKQHQLPSERDTKDSFTSKENTFSENGTKKCRIRKRVHECTTCGKSFQTPSYLKSHMRCHSGDKPFTCTVCGKAYRDKNNLKIHERSHSGELPYLCKHCGKGFTAAGTLRKHERTHTGEKPHMCSICEKKFIAPADLRYHMRTHSKEKPYMCSKCGSSFTHLPFLKQHEQCHSEKKLIECSECGLGFIGSNKLKEHMISHHKLSGRFVCARQECGKSYMYAYQLKKHEAKHEDTKPFGCTSCGRCYETANDLKKHEIVHGLKPDGNSDETSYTCSFCHKKYKTVHSYAKHIAKQHMDGIEPFICSVCGKEFREGTSLKKHEMTHSGERPLNCEICGKGFIFPLSLRRHMVKHTGDMPYKCTICGQGFHYKTRLDIHIMAHEGSKPFSCTKCAKGFTTKRQCEEHELVHGKDKPYLCSTCGMSFKVPRYLKEHAKIHMVDNPHRCTVCNKVFTKSSDLLIHIRAHTGDKPFKCISCGKSFACIQRLTRHKNTHLGRKPFSCSHCSKSYTELGSLRVHLKRAHQDLLHGTTSAGIKPKKNAKSEQNNLQNENIPPKESECLSHDQEPFSRSDNSNSKINDLAPSVKSIQQVSKKPSQIDSFFSVFGPIAQESSVNNMGNFTYDSLSEPQQIPVIFNSTDTRPQFFEGQADQGTNINLIYTPFSQALTTNGMSVQAINIMQDQSQENQEESLIGSDRSNGTTRANIPIDISYNPLNEGHFQPTVSMQFMSCDLVSDKSGLHMQPNFQTLTPTSAISTSNYSSYNTNEVSHGVSNVSTIPQTNATIENAETSREPDGTNEYVQPGFLQTYVNTFQNTDPTNSEADNVLIPSSTQYTAPFTNSNVEIHAELFLSENNQPIMRETTDDCNEHNIYPDVPNVEYRALNNREAGCTHAKHPVQREGSVHQFINADSFENPIQLSLNNELQGGITSNSIPETQCNKSESLIHDPSPVSFENISDNEESNSFDQSMETFRENKDRDGENGNWSAVDSTESPSVYAHEKSTEAENLFQKGNHLKNLEVEDASSEGQLESVPFGKEPCSCSLCDMEFLDTLELKQHMTSHTGAKPFKCSQCDTGFVNIYAMEKHMMIHRDERPFGCDTCSKRFRRKGELEKHKRIHTDQRPYQCAQCNKAFRQRSGLDNHMRTHTGEAPYECSICKKRFKQSTQVKRHMVVHTKEKKFKCELCNEAFCYSDALKRHVKTHTKQEHSLTNRLQVNKRKPKSFKKISQAPDRESKVEEYKCSVCKSVFKTHRSLMYHMRTGCSLGDSSVLQSYPPMPDTKRDPESPATDHLSEMPSWVCAVCEARFVGPKDLRKHMSEHIGSHPFKCTTCNRGFTEVAALKKHIGVHRKDKHLCSHCGKMYGSVFSLRVHMESHSEQVAVCKDCGLGFTTSTGLHAHAKRTHYLDSENKKRRGKLTCCVCREAFKAKALLVRHMAIHNKCDVTARNTTTVSYKCSHCDQNFVVESELKNHLKEHVPQRNHLCSTCGKGFMTAAQLKIHFRTHTGEKPYKCKICGQAFHYPGYLTIHKRIHSGEKPYTCSQCGKRFIQVAVLNMHMKSHLDHRPFGCSQCDKSFKSKRKLTVHLRVHSNERPYTCPICGKGFKRQEHCKNHEKIHSGLRDHACPKCEKTFIDSATLRRHFRTHSGEKPYTCSTCGKAFAETGTRNKHQRTHTNGTKAHVCAVCGRGFSERGSLTVHMRRHTGVKPFQCSTCNKGFTASGALNKHMKTHEKKKKICDVCSEEFTEEASLMSHMKVHGLDDNELVNDVYESDGTILRSQNVEESFVFDVMKKDKAPVIDILAVHDSQMMGGGDKAPTPSLLPGVIQLPLQHPETHPSDPTYLMYQGVPSCEVEK